MLGLKSQSSPLLISSSAGAQCPTAKVLQGGKTGSHPEECPKKAILFGSSRAKGESSLSPCVSSCTSLSQLQNKFLPEHVREARAIQYFLKGIKNIVRSNPPSTETLKRTEVRASHWLTSQHPETQERSNSLFTANGFILSVTTQALYFRINCTATVLLYSLFNSSAHYSSYKGSIRHRAYAEGNYSPHFCWGSHVWVWKRSCTPFHMAAACLSIIWHQTFWRLYLCVHISHVRS